MNICINLYIYNFSQLGNVSTDWRAHGRAGGRARAFVRAAHEGRVVNFGTRDTRDTTLAVPPPH